MFEKSYGPPYDFLRITKILKKSYGTPYDFLRITKILKKLYGTPYDFLRIIKILKNHMIPPMLFDKTIQKYNIFAWYSLKNIQINFSKCLYIPPPEIFENPI